MPTSQTTTPSGQRPKRSERSSRKWKVVGTLLIALLALVAVAPTLIGMTSIPNQLLSQAIPASVGKLTAGSSQFSWMGSTSLQQVRLADTAGNSLLDAERIEIDASLSQLLLNPNGPLRVTITNPIVTCQLDSNDSNWERFLAAYEESKLADETTDAGAQDNSSSDRPLSVRLLNGQVRVTDTVSKERWSLLLSEAILKPNSQQGVSALSSDLSSGLGSIEFSAIGTVESIGANNQPSPVKGNFAVKLAPSQSGQPTIIAKLGSLPASVVGPFLRRSDPSAAVKGWVSGEANATWSATTSNQAAGNGVLAQLIALGMKSSGQFAVSDAGYRGALTGGEPLELQKFEAPWQIAAMQGGLVIDRAAIASEIGLLTLAGSVSPNEIAALSNGKQILPAAMRLDADLNLVELARIAPEVLRLQEGMQIEEGNVKLQVAADSAPLAPGLPQRLAGTVSTNRLVGRSAGQRIEWRKPLQANFTVSQGPKTWQLETLTAQSSFANATLQTEPGKVTPAGQSSRLRGTAQFDLDELAKELSQFVDLGDWRLAGTGNATGWFERSPDQTAWQLVGTGKLTQMMIGTPERPLVAEPELQFEADLQGFQTEKTPSSGNLVLRAGQDKLTVTLANQTNAAAGVRPLDVKLEGDLARWYRRARLASTKLPSEENLRLAGGVNLSASGSLNPTGGELTRWNLGIQNFKADGSDQLRIREEVVKASGDLSWNQATGAIFSRTGRFATSTVSFSSRNAQLNSQNPTESRGELVFRGDVSGLQSWLAPTLAQEGWQASGALEGQAVLSADPKGMKVVAKLIGNQCVLKQAANQTANQPASVVWSEPTLESDLTLFLRQANVTEGVPEAAPLAIEIETLTLASQTMSGSARGKIGNLATLDQVNLSGGVDYDLQKLTTLFLPSMGDSIQLVGRERATFEIISDPAGTEAQPNGGNLSSGTSPLNRLRARVEAPWESANLFGLPVGPGRIRATLDDGLAKFDPLDVTVAQGRLTTQANLTLTPPPTSISLAPGPLVTNVAVSLEVAERILKFIAPVLSDAARIEGQFSLGLSEFSMPIKNPELGRAQGVLSIQQARVLPGPAVAEWVAIAQRVRGVARDGVEGVSSQDTELFTINNQNVEFQMANGRVYHKRLDFNVGEVIVTTQGSVGIDETLDMLLTIPILDAWVERRPALLGGLRGQAVRIPIQGTLQQPKVDQTALKQLTRDLIQSAAQGAINSGIESLFKRLQSK